MKRVGGVCEVDPPMFANKGYIIAKTIPGNQLECRLLNENQVSRSHHTTMNESANTLTSDDPFHPHDVVLGVQNLASDIRWLHALVQERIRQELSVELRMVRRPVEYDIPNASQLVSDLNENQKGERDKIKWQNIPSKEMETLAYEEE